MANVILLQKGDLKKSDFTNDNSNNKQGIGIRISPQDGNLLEKRSDGLYYGIQPPPDLANLYVSNSGDDGAVGSRANPLRTLEEALRRIPNAPQRFTIHLHEGHSFELHTKHSKTLASLTLRQYGPQTDSTHPDSGFGNLYYRGYLAADLNRPVINVYTHVTDHSVRRAGIIGDSLTSIGLHFKVHGIPPEIDDGTKGGDMEGILGTVNRGFIRFYGSILEVLTAGKPIDTVVGNYRNDVYFRGNIVWLHSKLVPEDLSTTKQNNQYSDLLNPAYTDTVHVRNYEPTTMITGTGEKKGSVLTTEATSKTYFSIDKNIHAAYNRTSRLIYGIDFQWDALTTSGL